MRLTNLGICQVRSLVRHLRISESTVAFARAEKYAPALGFGLWSLFLVLGWRRLKQTGSERGNPTSYRRDSFGSVAIIYIAYFNRISQTYLTFTTSHVFIYYIIRRIVLRNLEYRPLGLKENK